MSGSPRLRSALLLLTAFAALCVSNGRAPWGPGAWMGPVLLLRFLRLHRSGRAVALAALVLACTALWQWGDALGPMRGPLVVLGGPLLGVLLLLPYLADRRLAPCLGGFASTLVLPTAWVSADLLTSLLVADVGFIGYSQVDEPRLLQLASITGVFGLTFLVAWWASVVNHVWERGGRWRETRGVVLTFGTVLVALELFGALRLRPGSAPLVPQVRVAGLRIDAGEAGRWTKALRAPGAEKNEEALTKARLATHALQERLLAGTARLAARGAQIIGWAEVSGHVLAEEEEALHTAAGRIARAHGVSLVLALGVVTPGQERLENVTVLIGPDGGVEARYRKSFLSPGEPSLPGDGRLPQVRMPEGGVLSSAICADFSDHWLLGQAGRAGVDVMVGPASEWKGITPLSTHMARLRAVEGGFSLLKPTRGGLSAIVDPTGRLLASADPSPDDEQELMAPVPARGVSTVYSRIGDTFAFTCAAVLGVLSLSLVRRRSAKPRA